MAFTLVTAQTLLARNAGVLYGLQLGTVDMAAYSLQMGTTTVTQAAFLNSVYAASVGSATVAAVAAQVVTGVGILSTNTALYQIGIDYVTSELNKGTVATRGAIINDIISLFSNSTADVNLGTLAIAFNNKITNALTHASTTGSANGSFANVSTTIATGAGSTFTLTTGVDNVTSASTVVSGTVDQLLATNSTWTIGDTIASAANSTANMTLLTNGTNAVGLSATGVATLNVKVVDQNAAATNSGLDVASFTDLKTLKIANSATLGTTILTADTFSVTGLAAGNIISLDTNGQYTNTSFTFASAATQGSADTVTLNVAGRSGGVNVATGFETAAITTTGTTARIAALSTTTAKTLTIAGTGLKIDSSLDTTLTSIDASTSTGNVDIFVTGATTLTSIKAGAGTADKLTANALSTANIVSGFEQINAATAATYDLTGVTGATKLGIDAAATTGTVTFTNVAATTNTLSFSGGNQRTTAADTTSSITTGSVTYTLKTATGTSDALTITVDNGTVASTGTYAAGTLVLSGLEIVTFTATDWKANSFTGITDTVGSTGNLAFTATATATNLSFGTVAIAGGGTSGNTFNLGAVTGTTSATFTGTDNFTFTGGTGVDTFTTGAVASLLTQTFNAGAGNDLITVAAVATTGTLNINADAGDDTITLAANTAQTGVGSFNIDGGAGTLDTIKVTGGTSVINTMVGIEKISVQAAVTTTIAASSVLANNTVEITQIAAGTVAFTATASQTANISGVTQVGTAILTLTSAAGATAEILTGSSTVATTFNSGAGADTMTGGAGVDTYRFDAKASITGALGINVDSITNFTTASDKINISSGLGAGATLLGITIAADTTAAAFAAGIVDATAVASLTDVYTAINANVAFSNAGNFAVSATGAGNVIAKTITFANGAAAGQYLVINDATAAFQAANDIVIKVTGTVVAADLSFTA